MLIEIKNLYKIYSKLVDTVALTDISLSIEKGEFIAIAGSNASGKSTLLKCMAGFEEASSGSVLINGNVLRDMDENEIKEFRSRTIGFIFQDFGLLDFMTVKENLLIPLEIAGFNETEKKSRIEKMADLLDLKPLLKRTVNELSGGQQQRVAIAVALINDPEIIFADEPTSNLDKEWRMKVMSLIVDLWKNGKTIIMVSHDSFDLEHAQRIIVLDKGYLADSSEVVAK